MTKQEMFDKAKEILAKHGVNEGTALYADVTALLEPKKGGASIDIDSIVRRDAEGNIVELQCRLSGKWLPANSANFFIDKGSKIVNAAGEELYTLSRQAQKIRADFAKALKASQDAIRDDVLNEVITPAEGKAKIAELPTEPDYSVVEAIVAADTASE